MKSPQTSSFVSTLAFCLAVFLLAACSDDDVANDDSGITDVGDSGGDGSDDDVANDDTGDTGVDGGGLDGFCVVPEGCDDDATPKCGVLLNGQNQNVPTCTELLGAVGEDEICARPTDDVGIDDCAQGLYCAFYGLPQSTPQDRVCRRLCTGVPGQCDDDDVCLSLGTGQAGHCSLECDPWGDDCGDGLKCDRFFSRFETADYVFSCNWDGFAQAGQGCTFQDDCTDGLTCLQTETNAGFACLPLCDGSHSCDSGGSCLPLFVGSPGVSGMDHSGTCFYADWSCLDDSGDPPVDSIDTMSVTFNNVGANATANLCDVTDENCDSPLQSESLDGDETIAFDVPTDTDVYVQYSDDANAETLIYASIPLLDAGGLSVTLQTVDELEARVISGDTLNEERGQIWIRGVLDCGLAAGTNTYVNASGADSDTIVAYNNYTDTGYDDELGVTGWSPSAIIGNVPGSSTTLSTELPTGEENIVESRDVWLRAGGITIVYVVPAYAE